MQTWQRFLASASAPWIQRERRWSAWIGCGLLALLGAGCASWKSEGAAAAFRDRILPPAEAGDLSSAPLFAPLPAEPVLPDVENPPTSECLAKPQAANGPLTLEQAIDLGYRLNPNLQVLWEQVEQARGGKQVAFAAFLPQSTAFFRDLQGTPAHERFALPTIPTVLGNFSLPDISDNFQMTEINVQWTIWDFGRAPGRYGQATAALDIARLQYHRGRQTVAFNVAAAYFAVLQAHAAYMVAEEAVRRAESFLRD